MRQRMLGKRHTADMPLVDPTGLELFPRPKNPRISSPAGLVGVLDTFAVGGMDVFGVGLVFTIVTFLPDRGCNGQVIPMFDVRDGQVQVRNNEERRVLDADVT